MWDKETKYQILYNRKDKSNKSSIDSNEFNTLSGSIYTINEIEKDSNNKIIGFLKTTYKQEFLSIGDVIFVANINLGKHGNINRSVIYIDKNKALDLKEYVSNPMAIKNLASVLFVQNVYSAISIKTEYIVDISIDIIEKW